MARTGKTLAGQPLWSEQEMEICRNLYPDYKAIRKKLRRRTLVAVQHKCNELGLVQPRIAWTGADIARLRRLFPSAPREELLAAFPGRSRRAIQHAANSRGIVREKKPYKLTGHDALDALRARCFVLGLTMVDLDDYARSGQHFSKANWRSGFSSDRYVIRAARAIGGTISIDWGDDI